MISKKKNIAIILGDEAFNYIIDTVVFYKTNSGLNTFINTSIVSSNIPNDYLKNRVNSKFDSSL